MKHAVIALLLFGPLAFGAVSAFAQSKMKDGTSVEAKGKPKAGGSLRSSGSGAQKAGEDSRGLWQINTTPGSGKGK